MTCLLNESVADRLPGRKVRTARLASMLAWSQNITRITLHSLFSLSFCLVMVPVLLLGYPGILIIVARNDTLKLPRIMIMCPWKTLIIWLT